MAGLVEIRGKKCLITGGASGLGALYAQAFLEEGAEHVTIVDVAEEKGKETADQLNKTYPGRATFIKCDVGDEDSITRCFNQVVNNYKRLDVIINNAGILNDSPAVWRKSCDVNWQGLVSFTMKGLSHMRVDEGGAGGTIANVSSVAALIPSYSSPIYCGSKAAVLHFSQSISAGPFYESTGIRILTICFGPTDTALMQNLTERVYEDNLGSDLEGLVKELTTQKAESAVTAFISMFKNGGNGSVWLSEKNLPVQNITSKVTAFHESFM